MKNQDTLFLYAMTVHAVIGVHDKERSAPQPLIINIEMGTDAQRAAQQDRLDDAIDYAQVAALIKTTLQKTHFQLLETAAEYLVNALIQHFNTPWVTLRIRKPHALTHTQHVGIAITRYRTPDHGSPLRQPTRCSQQ